MKYLKLHPWNVSYKRAAEIQVRLEKSIILKCAAKNYKYILLNAPTSAIGKISDILPGMKSPTIIPLAEEGWSSIHSVIREDDFWVHIENLKKVGAQGILVIPIEKMII